MLQSIALVGRDEKLMRCLQKKLGEGFDVYLLGVTGAQNPGRFRPDELVIVDLERGEQLEALLSLIQQLASHGQRVAAIAAPLSVDVVKAMEAGAISFSVPRYPYDIFAYWVRHVLKLPRRGPWVSEFDKQKILSG